MPNAVLPDALSLAPIQPIVLVGGASARFGRDKLLEPLPDGMLLVDRPINALRQVFGPCVALVGNCDERISSRGDLALADRWPRTGPAGGIATALSHFGRDVFVLAGDLPAINAALVRSILRCAQANPSVAAVLADSGHLEPCIGLYRQASLTPLLRSLDGGERLSIVRRLDGVSIVGSPAPAQVTANANTPHELRTSLLDPLTRGAS